MAERVSNLQEYFEKLSDRFVAGPSKGVNATIFFDLADGPNGGQWTMTVTDGTFSLDTGKAVEKPTVTITMKPEHYVEMANGDLDGTKAFMTRKLKIAGSIPMAQKMKSFLPRLKG